MHRPSGPQTPAEAIREHRKRLHRSARHWGVGALGFVGAIVVAFVVYATVSSLDDVAVWVTMLSIVGLALCVLVAMAWMVQSLLPYHPAASWTGDPDADLQVVMEHGRANDRWVTRAQVFFLGGGLSIILAVLLTPWLTPLIWIGMILFAGGLLSFGGVLVQNSRAASAIARLDREAAAQYGAELAEHLTVRNRWAPLHWWEWLGEFVFIMGVILGGVILMDPGMKAGWLPHSRDVATGIMGGLPQSLSSRRCSSGHCFERLGTDDNAPT